MPRTKVTDQTRLRHPPRSLSLLGIGILLWLIPVTLTSALVGVVGHLELRQAVALSVWIWFGWAIFLPLSVWFSFRFPIGPGFWLRHALLHCLLCLLVVIGSQVIARLRSVRPLLPQLEEWHAQERDGTSTASDFNSPTAGPPRVWYQRYRGAPPQARVILDTLLYAIILAGCQSVHWAQVARERDRQALAAEAQLAKAQLLGLQSQLNPHFLFNALNGLNALIHDAPRDAEILVDHLSDLLRAALAVSDEQEISLGRELECLEHYLAVEKTRYGDRLRVAIEVESSARDCLVPTFLLQPLVENAVKHGVEPRQQGARIVIKASRREDALALCVLDTGPGLKQGGVSGSGVGLLNCRRRLEQCFPSNHQFSIENHEEGGCVVSIVIPWQTQPSEQRQGEGI